jgi:hypothetical protein
MDESKSGKKGVRVPVPIASESQDHGLVRVFPRGEKVESTPKGR